MNRLVHAAWLRRTGLVLGWCLVGLQLLYVLAANTILWTHSLDRWVTGATKGLFLRTGSAWTLWPGRVHISQLELHFEDHNVQFSIQLHGAVVDLRLRELPLKTFHLTRVRAQDVHYLMRHRVKDTQGIERRLQRYPRIAGYADPPLFEGPDQPPLSDAQYNLWTIQLEDVDASVRELWFLEYRFLGRGRATGGFRLKPQRDARTERCALSFDGKLVTGDQLVAAPFRGEIHAQLDRHDPRRVPGAAVFKKISFDMRLYAHLPDLAVSQLYSSEARAPLQGGAGPLQVRAVLRHGEWQTTTELRYASRDIGMLFGPAQVAGRLGLRAAIVDAGGVRALQLAAASSSLHLAYLGSPRKLLGPRTRHARLELRTTSDLTQPLRLLAVSAELRLHAPDLRWLGYPLEQPEVFGGGSAALQASGHWEEGALARLGATLQANDAVLLAGPRRLRASGSLRAQLRYDATQHRGHAGLLRVDLPDFAVAMENDERWRALPGGVHAHVDAASWHGLPPHAWHMHGSLDAQSIDALAPLLISSGLLRSLAFAVFHLGTTHVVVEAEQTPAALELQVPTAHSGAVQAAAAFRKPRDRPPCGWLFVHSEGMNVGMVLEAGSTSLRPFVSDGWSRGRAVGAALVCKAKAP